MSKNNTGYVGQSLGGQPQQIHGSEPSVVEDQHKWTVFNSQVNLPAVLNDPRLSRRETDFFTKTWGESFEKTSVYPSPHLQDITRDHFKRYLKKTTGVCNASFLKKITSSHCEIANTSQRKRRKIC